MSDYIKFVEFTEDKEINGITITKGTEIEVLEGNYCIYAGIEIDISNIDRGGYPYLKRFFRCR